MISVKVETEDKGEKSNLQEMILWADFMAMFPWILVFIGAPIWIAYMIVEALFL